VNVEQGRNTVTGVPDEGLAQVTGRYCVTGTVVQTV
jgi:hypothetical protein